MDIVDLIKNLCDDRGETLASLERKLDFGNGTIRRWSNKLPSGDKLEKVADYFNVSVDYLLGREQTDTNRTLENVYFSFAKNAQDNGIHPDDIEAALEIIKKFRN